MAPQAAGRRPRSGPPRRPGPGGRGPAPAEADLGWELWNFRTLFPDAGPADLRVIKNRMDGHLAREREALAGLWSGDRSILSPGHAFLDHHPDLRRGIVCSLHLGPYQFLSEPFVRAGLEPGILLNRRAMESFRPGTEAMIRRLGYRPGLEWVPVDDGPFLKRAVMILKAGRPLLVYLDGNTGAQGMAATRSAGLRYRLPGRDIRVRTGLVRLAARLGVPVHRVVLGWSTEGDVVWERDPTLTWPPTADAGEGTRALFDWCFSRVMQRPDQWQYWAMLKESCACFAAAGPGSPGVPTGLRDDLRRAFLTCLERSPATVRLVLEKSVAVWPGQVLADLSEDRFYPAAGLRDEDLEPLRSGRPTLADLREHHGESWVRFHGLRLCLLGMARLGG